MRTFAQKQNQPQDQTTFNLTRSGMKPLAPGHELPATTHLQRTVNGQGGQQLPRISADSPEVGSDSIVTNRFAHDFSRIPIHSPRQTLVHPELPLRSQSISPVAAKGEALLEGEPFSPIKGEPGEGTQEESTAKGEGTKKVTKAELGAPTASECGAYSWKVRFSVENADATTKGYVVQKVDAKYNRTDCGGKDKPVTGMGTFPFWEAWGVREGKVFIGDTDSAHNADTYSDSNMGDSTKGSIVVKGTPEFFPDVKLPAHMKANNPDTQAGALRSSITDPALTGGTGAISHNLTASWNCCPPSEKKTIISDKT